MSAIIHREWYNANESRAYPLDETATQVGDDGVRVPQEVIADLNLRVPDSLGTRVFLSGLTCTAGLVTATFSVDTMLGIVAVAAVTVVKPVSVYQNYAVTPLYPGVMGWIAFGHGADDLTGLAVRCSTAAQGLLAPRAARAYSTLPVTSIGIRGSSLKLTGMVSVESGGDLLVEVAKRTIDGECVDVILVRINAVDNPELLSDYAGPCGRRPENGSCADVPIKTINGLVPDCNGDIGIDFETPLLPGGYQCNDDGGVDGVIILDMPFGLGDVCPTPRDIGGTDLCEEEMAGLLGSLPGLAEFEAQILDHGVTLLMESSSSENGCAPLPDPFCEDFEDPMTDICYWEPFSGLWEVVYPVSSSSSSSMEGSP